MSVVIIGGNECMECRYKEICKQYGHEAKVFTKERGSVAKKMGCPDLVIMFTNTMSHKMMNSAAAEAKRNNIPIEWTKSSSASALKKVLAMHTDSATA